MHSFKRFIKKFQNVPLEKHLPVSIFRTIQQLYDRASNEAVNHFFNRKPWQTAAETCI